MTHRESHSGSGPPLVGQYARPFREVASNNDVAAVMRTFSDDRLALAIAEGQEDALVEAFERHGAAVFGFALTRVGEERAERVTRGVFLALWRDPRTFVPVHGSLRPALLEESLGWVIDRPRAQADTLQIAEEPTTSEVDLEQKLRGPWARPQ